MIKTRIGLVVFVLLSFTAVTPCNINAQSVNILDEYIRQGLKSNLAIQQKKLNLDKSLKALKEANSLFYPSVALEAQYFLADGGRAIDFPVGTLMNPVYSSLNSILTSMGEPAPFTPIQDQTINFLPSDYHDTKIRVIMPLVNSEIYFNKKIKQANISAAQAEVNAFARELVKDIKTGYFRYLQSAMVVKAYTSALELVTEAKRVNQKLVDNGLAGPEKRYRIEAEQMQITAQLTRAENDMKTAMSYFNFLLNRPLEENVTLDTALMKVQNPAAFLSDTEGLLNREEFMQMTSAIKSAGYYANMKKYNFLPVISNITDIGFQGYSYLFNSDQRYIMNTINLSWPLFNGFRNQRSIAQANIQVTSLQKQYDEIENQIRLQNLVAEGNLESSLKSERANKSSLESSTAYYHVIKSQYAEGQKSLLDLLDARNQLTASQIAYAISHFDTLIRLAELERANAGYDLDAINQ